jgi:hypothetical protein
VRFVMPMAAGIHVSVVARVADSMFFNITLNEWDVQTCTT